MRWATAKATGVLGEPQRGAFDAALRAVGASAVWRVSSRAQRSYALLRFEADADLPAGVLAAAANGAVAYQSPVIAIAVFPSVAEALPALTGAVCGPGGPAGVRACEPCGDGGAAIDWDLDVTPAAVVLDLVDVELARFGGGRTAELLSPLPPAWVSKIAADGLRAPEVSPGRTLETLVRQAGLHV